MKPPMQSLLPSYNALELRSNEALLRREFQCMAVLASQIRAQ